MNTIDQLKKYINESEYIIIGAGAGLSTAAGFKYDGEYFLKYFKYMHDLYGYNDMYSAGFHDFISLESKWAYWSMFIYLNRYKYGARELYKKLELLFKDKNYFVITTNVDHQFQLAGFDKSKLFYTQGDYGLFECRKCKKTIDNKNYILDMIDKIKDNKIPTSLIPRCPKCGSILETNLRCDDEFIEDEGWHKAYNNYKNFLEKTKNKKILYLELGVGLNTPTIIKYPFIKMTMANPNSHYVVINKDKQYLFDEIKDRTLILNNDINNIVDELLKDR